MTLSAAIAILIVGSQVGAITAPAPSPPRTSPPFEVTPIKPSLSDGGWKLEHTLSGYASRPP